jgi:hypothetical protein
VDGTVHSDYKALNANQTNWRRIVSYYEAHAEDRSRIHYTFRNTGLRIIIFVHEKVPLDEFKPLLLQFFQTMRTEDQVKNDKIDIRVIKRAQGPVVDEEEAVDDAE